MHQIADTAVTTLPRAAADFRQTRLQRVAAAPRAGGAWFEPQATRVAGARVVLVDLTEQYPLPARAVGLAAAALRLAGHQVDVVLPDAAVGRMQAWSRVESARERLVRRIAMSRGVLAQVLTVADRCGAAVASRVSGSAAAEGLAKALATRCDAVLVAVDGSSANAVRSTRALATARGVRHDELGSPSADALLRGMTTDVALVADYSDYPWDRTRVLPIEAGASSAQMVAHELRELARRHGCADFVFTDRALDADASRFAAIVDGMQRNVPGAQWIARFDPAAAQEPMTRKTVRAAAAAGLRRIAIAIDREGFAAAAALAELAGDAGVAVEGRFSSDLVQQGAATMRELAAFLRDNAARFDRVRVFAQGAGGTTASTGTNAARLELTDAMHAINARPARRVALTFEGIA